MNEILNNMLTRRSIRKFQNRPVPQEIIDQIITSGLYAPSGMGSQSTIIIQVANKQVRDKLSSLNAAVMGRSGIDPFYGASCVLIVLADKNAPTYLYDGCLTMGNMMNMANALGIGSCWIHRAKQVFESKEGKEILSNLGIEGDYEGIGNLILGYADETPSAKPRKGGRIYYIK